MYSENHSNRPEILAALRENIGISKRYSATLKQNMLYVALPLTKKGQSCGIIRLALPLIEVEKTIFHAKKIALISFGLGLLLAITFSLLISHSFAKPIKKITEATTAMAKGDLKKRVGIYPKNEMGTLAHTIDNLARQLEQYINQLSQEKAYLETILKSVYEGIMVTNEKGEIILFNETLKSLFPQVSVGKTVLEVLRDATLVEGIEEIMRGKGKLSIEATLPHPKERVFEVHLYNIRYKTETMGTIAIFYDITHLKRLEKTRSDFVANVSHELRTPITNIKGYAETLLDEKDSEKIKEFGSIVLKHTDFLIELTQDLIELSTIETEGFRLEKDHISLKELIDDTIETFKEEAQRKSIALKAKIEETQTIWANRERARQVFNNLIDNAIKYTERGFIEISTEERDQFIIIKVSDTGIGIPKKDLSRIFERFYRVNKNRSRALGGAGLGLSIVKHIVEAHGGEVWVESSFGNGSTFYTKWPKEMV